MNQAFPHDPADRIDPVAAAGTVIPSRPEDPPAAPKPVAGATDRSIALILAALLCWRLLHAMFTPMVITGMSLVAALVVTAVVVAMLLVAIALVVRRSMAHAGQVVLAALTGAGVGTALVATFTQIPWLGLDTAVAALVAAVVLSRRQLVNLLMLTAVAWSAALGFAVVTIARSYGGDMTMLGEWLLTAAGIAAGLGIAWFVNRHITLLQRSVESATQDAQEHSVRDSLTGLANRNGLTMVADPMVEQAWRTGQSVHGLYVAVDGMRKVNDKAGLAAGDEVLCAVATAISGSVRGTDVAARWTGDEFVIVGPGSGTTPREMENRIRSRLKERPAVSHAWEGNISIGSAMLLPWDDADLIGMVHRAERDMQLRRSLRRQGASNMSGPQSSYAETKSESPHS